MICKQRGQFIETNFLFSRICASCCVEYKESQIGGLLESDFQESISVEA